MTSNFLKKKAAFQQVIRKNNKQTAINQRRQALMSFRISSFYKNIIQEFLSTEENPLSFLQKIYQDLISCSPFLFGTLSFSAALFLSQFEKVIIESDAIQDFLQIACEIVKVEDHEILCKLASRQYSEWLFKWLVLAGERDLPFFLPLYTVFTSLSQASIQSKPIFSNIYTVSEIIERHWDSHSQYSRILLSATLMHASPEQLSTPHKKRLLSLARFLFDQKSGFQTGMVEEDLLFWISRLVSFSEKDWPILRAVMGKKKQCHDRLTLLHFQTIEQSWITYQDIRSVLLELSSQLNTTAHQITFMNILRSCIINAQLDPRLIMAIYDDFFLGKMEAFFQKPLLYSLLELFGVTASTLLQIEDPRIPQLMVRCLEDCSDQMEDYCECSNAKILVIEALLEKRILSEHTLTRYLSFEELQFLWRSIEDMGQEQLDPL